VTGTLPVSSGKILPSLLHIIGPALLHRRLGTIYHLRAVRKSFGRSGGRDRRSSRHLGPTDSGLETLELYKGEVFLVLT
jgi:hypothetical protein